jgi:sporulation protein YlmC with PRC-barrel domain
MKRYHSSAATAAALSLALALGGAAALAQETTGTGATTVAPGDIDAQQLIGRTVENPDGENIGEIESAVIDQDGTVRYLIVGVGGFLGVGERDVALAWDDLTISENGERVTTSLSKEQLAALPEHRFPESIAPGAPYPYDEAVRANPYLDDQDMAGDTTATPEQAEPAAGTTGIAASSLVGATVTNARDENIGEINEIILSNDGMAESLVVDVGGFLGVGERRVLVDWTDVTIRSDEDRDAVVVATDLERTELEALPEYQRPAAQ